jgi:hypothetical protein
MLRRETQRTFEKYLNAKRDLPQFPCRARQLLAIVRKMTMVRRMCLHVSKVIIPLMRECHRAEQSRSQDAEQRHEDVPMTYHRSKNAGRRTPIGLATTAMRERYQTRLTSVTASISSFLHRLRATRRSTNACLHERSTCARCRVRDS